LGNSARDQVHSEALRKRKGAFEYRLQIRIEQRSKPDLLTALEPSGGIAVEALIAYANQASGKVFAN